ncbi:MAG: FYDLN acid domain-containing protein, partial [Thermoanaerobaculia bacterium]
MPELGKKFNCYSCHTKFYDLGKPIPLCPKCGADQRDAEEAPLITPSRSRASRAAAVVVEPVDDDFAAEGETPARPVVEGEEEEEAVPEADREEVEDDSDE